MTNGDETRRRDDETTPREDDNGMDDFGTLFFSTWRIPFRVSCGSHPYLASASVLQNPGVKRE
ncbi:hypothetical protein ACRALDRAFT_210411 [Sodiomyces alcalophilus JCM 7366]|uniref:uncharacterized protein n=1 Tax=Sodiomyces alcalophilus JCM 7366 TaxID=591952 RepID=UPI0039B5FE4E